MNLYFFFQCVIYVRHSCGGISVFYGHLRVDIYNICIGLLHESTESTASL
jgi:hypothetical protein